MGYREGIDELADIGGHVSLADAQHAKRHNDANDALREVGGFLDDARGIAVVSATPPEDPEPDQLWFDTTAGEMKRWDASGEEWMGLDKSALSAAPLLDALIDRPRLLAWHDFARAENGNLNGQPSGDGRTWTASTASIASGVLNLGSGTSNDGIARLDIGQMTVRLRAAIVGQHSTEARTGGLLVWYVDADNYFVASVGGNSSQVSGSLTIDRRKDGTTTTVASAALPALHSGFGQASVDVWARHFGSGGRIAVGVRGIPLLSYELTSDDASKINVANYGLRTRPPGVTGGNTVWQNFAAWRNGA
jgi:hypothetical protein